MVDISIITATYNSEKTLEKCIDSIASQTNGVEHIIIDGKSSDATLDILESKRASVSRIVSEPDQGIYHAMNKGLGIVSGDVIGILNSDDYYASNNIIQTVAEVFEDPNVKACYGDLVYVDEEDHVIRFWRSGSHRPADFYWGWMPPHPTFFVRRSVYEDYGGFNTDLGSAADYEIMLRFLLKHQIKATYIPEVMVNMRMGGVSNASLTNRLKANRMDRKAWEVNGLKPYPWTLMMKPLRKIRQWLV